VSREEKIKKIAYDLWQQEGCIDGHDVEHWIKAETIWNKQQNRILVSSLLITALMVGIIPLLEWKLDAYKPLFGIISACIFALVLAIRILERKLNRKLIIWRQIFSLAVIALYFILFLDYERQTGTFQETHQIFLIIVFSLAVVFVLSKGWWQWLIDLVGLEGEFTTSMLIKIELSTFGAALISMYLLLSGQNNTVPSVLQFSIIPISATLGGLVISGANYSKLNGKRTELLKVAQKLIVATIAFIFFTAILFLAGDVKPNVTPSTQIEWTKYVFFWLSAFLFYVGTTLFVIGIVDLAISLKNLKKE
jgi:hypothetical protein